VVNSHQAKLMPQDQVDRLLPRPLSMFRAQLVLHMRFNGYRMRLRHPQMHLALALLQRDLHLRSKHVAYNTVQWSIAQHRCWGTRKTRSQASAVVYRNIEQARSTQRR